jgi:hypothetical protein
MASCSSSGSLSSSCSNMGCRFCPQARVKSAAADCVGATLLPSSAALPCSGVVTGVCYSVASGTSAEIGAAAT